MVTGPTGMVSASEMTTKLNQLKTMTTIVADTGDFESIRHYHPTDATTNPSLILQAAQLPAYKSLVEKAVTYAKTFPKEHQMEECIDKLMVLFGSEILKIVPGRVSTEVDAKLSYDTEKTVCKALKLVKMYEELGMSKDRVLIKIASTWEGIHAARTLESVHGIHCNLTLLFSFVQAVACAEAGATLISPFVGRILDWYKKAEGRDYSPAEDPGVLSVKEIYNYLKKHGHSTIVMGASFRNAGELLELAGIDYLTISPKLLEELSKSEEPIERKLDPEAAKTMSIPKATFIDDEVAFRTQLESNKMAHELLHDGIRRFDEDSQKLALWIHGLCNFE